MSSEPKVVLVVEDDADNASVLREVLEEEGYAVTRANDGEEALKFLHAGVRPGLVLMDLMMPNMNGWRLATELRSDPKWQSIPLLLLTADSRAAVAAEQLGVNGCLSKPVDLGALIDAVATHYRNTPEQNPSNSRTTA